MALELGKDFGMEDTEAKRLRGRAKASLTRIINALQLQLSKNDIIVRLEKLEEAFKDFDKYDCLLDAKDSEIEEFAETYFDTRVKLQNMLDEIVMNENVVSINTSPVQAIKGNFKLPRLNIQSFNGNYTDWLSFKDLYISTVHDNLALSKVQKFQYLKGLLLEEPAAIIKHIPVCENSYDEAWQKLLNRYDKKKQIVNSLLKTFIEQPIISKVNGFNLRQLADTSDEVIRGLKSLHDDATSRDPWLIYLLLQKVDCETRQIWSQKTCDKEFPTFEEFIQFLNERCSSLEVYDEENNKKWVSKSDKNVKSNLINNLKQKCPKCNGGHGLHNCIKFKQLDVESRRNFVYKSGLCFVCFKNHTAKSCTSNFLCRICKNKHNTLLHENSKNALQVSSSSNKDSLEEAENTNLSVNTNKHSCNSLLPTAVVEIKDSSGQVHDCRILLDSASMASFISESCLQKLNLKRRNARIAINGIGGSKADTTRGIVNVTIIPKTQEKIPKLSIQAFVLNKLTSDLPSEQLDTSDLNYLKGIALADPHFSQPGKVDIIIGADYVFQTLCPGQIMGTKNNPIAQNTVFGWVISGRLKSKTSHPRETHLANMHSEINIDKTLREFWQTEEINYKEKVLTDEEQFCESSFENNYKILEDGKFEVQLPFFKSKDLLGESRSAAVSRLFAMERKFKRDEILEKEYKDFMREYEDMNHMIHASLTDKVKHYFLPHHAVLKPDSVTTQLRVVFDASSKTSTSVSLNSILGVGPIVQRDLFSILLNFRMYEFAFTADIAKMYRQVWISEEDQNYQVILWWNNSNSQMKEFKLRTLTYGTASAPFLATRVLKQIGINCEIQNPILSKIILNDFYMDDLLSGVNNISEGMRICSELSELLSSHGFNLRKWRSNSNEILNHIATDSKTLTEVRILPSKESKVLGLYWDSNLDCFTFKIVLKDKQIVTKRHILSESAKIFDPLGLLSPCTITIKIFYQKLWLQNLDWDTILPSELQNDWNKFQENLSSVNLMKIPRWLNTHKIIQIHGFSDASELAYAAVLYTVQVIADGSAKSSLMVAKTKVCPIKQISIPRLELNAARLLARLVQSVKVALKEYEIEIFAWTDSTVVLAWLANHPRKWKQFVANRTSEILETIPFKMWGFVKSKENPADIASRGQNANLLINNELWWNGPPWLIKNSEYWPKMIQVQENTDTTVERKLKVFNCDLSEKGNFFEKLFDTFSSLSKIIGIVAYCLRFITKCRKYNIKLTNPSTNIPLNCVERNNAMLKIVLFVQSVSFSKELHLIKNKKCISTKSSLLPLNPFIDETGALRVGGRLQKSLLPFDVKHPFIIPADHNFTKLLIQQYHVLNLHAGQTLLTNILKQKFWIINCRKMVKKIINRCITCARYRQAKATQIMGNLPEARVRPSRPFENTGLDYAGHFILKFNKGRGSKTTKGYVAIFVCFSTKAIHLEAVSDLSAESFIAALRRFSARRGAPRHIFCDNGRNFVGAQRQLKDIEIFLQSVNENEEIAFFLSQSNIEFNFIPPASPHFGGLWEAAVKSMKFHLKRVIGETILTFEEMTTLLTQIEACLNSRPLVATNSSDLEIPVLTPSHFLIGDVLISPVDDNTVNNLSYSSRWHLVQSMRNGFWKAWKRDYLTALQPRVKWHLAQENLKEGDVVLVKDGGPPGSWMLGRVISTHPGTDAMTRVVTLKTSVGTLKRPISKLVVLPVDCQDA